MAFLNSNTDTGQRAAETASEIRMAEESCKTAKNAINDAMLALGKTVYEAEKEKTDSAFNEEIALVTDRIKKSELWKQYRLTLEGKMRCDACGAIITSDSLFCNKCGTGIEPLDFTPLGLDAPAPAVRTCPSCGAELAEDALFCEKCGQKVE